MGRSNVRFSHSWQWGALILILMLGCPPAWAISVSISDNVVVLDGRQRSGEIELLSMTPTPVEFEVTLMDASEGVLDGRDHLRWSPARTMVPPNRGRPLRMVFRPHADLPPGEYVVRLAVQSRPLTVESNVGSSPVDDRNPSEPGLTMAVRLQPVLPITVYMRHEVSSPELTVGAFERAVDDAQHHGHFIVSKAPDAISFVGTVALVGADTGRVFSRGRLRMGQTVATLRVRVPRAEGEATLDEPVCLHIWPTFPASGEPDQRVCSG
jgi:hypothetical protein